MTRYPLLAALAASVAAGGLLAGCGGDGSSEAPPPPPPPPVASDQVPASAAASDASLEAFAFGLARSETTEPLKLDNVTTLPSSETDEPIAVN